MNLALLINSLLVSGATAVCAGLGGFAAALGLHGLPQRWQRVGIVCCAVALGLPSFAATNCWLDLLGSNGWLGRWLPINVFSLPGAVGLLTILLWPIPCLLTWAAWRQIEPTLLEFDPALRGAMLVRALLWPMARNAVLLGMAIVFVLAMNNFAVPSILQVKVLPAAMWVEFNTNLDTRAAFAAGWPMIAVAALLVLTMRLAKISWPRRHGGEVSGPFRRQLGSGIFFSAVSAGVVLVVVSVLVPLAQLACSMRTWTEFFPAMRAGLGAIGNSGAYAAAAAVLALALGLLLGRVPGAAIAWLAFLVPGIFLGIALVAGLNRPELHWAYQSALIVILALLIRYVAIVWSVSRAAMAGLDRSAVDMLRVEGASRIGIFRHGIWPQVAPQTLGAAYLVYLLCLWDVETLVMIVPPGGETLAVRIYNLLHYGHNAHVNALCVLLLLLAVMPLGLWLFCAWRHQRRRASVLASTALCLSSLIVLAGCAPEGRPAASRLRSSLFSHVEIIGSRGTAPGQFNKPRSVAVDAQDNLFVVDMTGRVQKFSPDGRYLAAWHMPQTDLGKAKGMDRDRAGNVVVLEPHYQRVNHFDPAGRLVHQWGRSGTNIGELSLPRSVAVDSRSNVVVTEYWAVERVQKFSPRGELLAAWGRAGLQPGEFNRPEGVGVDLADRIYVADSCNHRIQVFSPDGQFLHAYGTPGAGPGQLSYPYDVRIDAEGRQFVCEFGNSRIQVFDPAGRSIEIIGEAGGAPGEFSNPWSITLDSQGNLYVADSQNHRVQKLVRSHRRS